VKVQLTEAQHIIHDLNRLFNYFTATGIWCSTVSAPITAPVVGVYLGSSPVCLSWRVSCSRGFVCVRVLWGNLIQVSVHWLLSCKYNGSKFET